MDKSNNDIVREALFALKHEIHDKAAYPQNVSVSPYISLKAFDAILQGYLNKYDDHRG